jgi:hypothetical protein
MCRVFFRYPETSETLWPLFWDNAHGWKIVVLRQMSSISAMFVPSAF